MNYQIGGKTVQYVSCDDSTAAKGSWDPQTCTNNANSYKSVTNLLGVIGTFNSGCAEIERPDPEPRSRRRDRDGQPRQHVRRAHEADGCGR